jgi:hypothetical protein
MDDLMQIAKAEHWPGYFGSPRLASAAFGAQVWKMTSSLCIELALKILDGFDYRQLKRLGDVTKTVPANMGIDKAALEHEQQSNEGSRSGSETRDWNNLEAGSVTQQPWGRSRFSPTATLRRTAVGA